MVRQRELGEFRTPQHPGMGTNNWGGASPLLARNIPNESLEQRYERLNSVRTDGEIFAVGQPLEDSGGDEFLSFSKSEASKYGTPGRGGLSLVRKLGWRVKLKKKNNNSGSVITLNSTPKKKKWVGRWDPKNRWPQGWC